MSKQIEIGVVSVGLGNVNSIHRMIEKAGARSVSVSTAADLEVVRSLVLPGVGHFDAGINALKYAGLFEPLRTFISRSGKPVLGICLGMHLLCRNSTEGVEQGLGIVNASVKKFPFSNQQDLKVPHMGWNTVMNARVNSLLLSSAEDQRYYFAHSYRVIPDTPAITIGLTDYGGIFCAAFQQSNVYGVQFHPEKSHRFGLGLIKRFAAL